MIECIPFQAKHLRELSLQPAQEWMRAAVDSPDYAKAMEAADAYTVLIDGTIVAVAGVTTIWPGRAHLSGLISTHAGPAMLVLHRLALRYLEASPIRRIEATVDDLFLPGHRWLLMLGFKRETPHGMLGYMPDGRRAFLYARIK